MPLMIPTGMHADESGAGALMRAADENGYLAGSQLTGFMGLEHVRAETLFGMSPDLYAEPAAALLGADPTIVRRAFHPASGGYCEFYGTKIRVRDREISKRRVAPASLRTIGYHKAAWQLRPLQFDPQTLEMLISNCPVCGQELGFVRAAGICHCERCMAKDEWGFVEPQVDLRDFPQPIIEVGDRHALTFVTSLVDPDPEIRSTFRTSMHDDLTHLTRGQLWDFALALSCVVSQDPQRSATSIARPKGSDFGKLYSPDRLAAAGRIILSWPSGFDEMCERARVDTHLRGDHGVKAELGQIYALSVNASMDPDIRQVAKGAIHRNMKSGDERVRRVEYRADDSRVSTQAASQQFGIHTRVLRKIAEDPAVTVFTTGAATGPRLFLTDEIEALAAMRDKIDSISTVAIRLGVPSSAVRDIAAAGLIEAVTGPVLHLVVGKEYFLRESVDRLVSAISSKVVSRPAGAHLRLIRAMNRLGAGEKRWADLIKAILDGRLTVFRIEGRLSATFTKLAVGGFDELQDCLIEFGSVEGQLDTVTRPEAGSILGISVPLVCALVLDGRIEQPAVPGGPLRKEAVLDAARTFIFTSEISRRIETGARWVRTRLGEHGIQPVFELPGKRGLAFDRRAVEAVLRSIGNA